MESPLLSYPLLFLSLLFSLLSIIFLKIKSNSNSNSNSNSKPILNFPPGPRPLPLIGNLHQLLGSLPHHAFRDLSNRYGSIIFLQFGEIPTVIISSPEAAREVLKTHDVTFASRSISTTLNVLTHGGKGIAFSPYGEYWRQVRKICTLELLSTKRVRSFRTIREEGVRDLIGEIYSCSSHNKLVDLSEGLALMVNDVAARVILGNKCDKQDIVLKEIERASKLGAGLNLSDLFPSSWLAKLVSGARKEAERSRQVVDSLLDDIIKQHREETDQQEDLVQVLLRIYDEGNLENILDMEAIKTVIFGVFTAGSETSSTTLEWAMSELIRNRRVMEKAQSEVRGALKGHTNVSEPDLVKLNYLHLVIKETLRLHPPAPLLLPRQCRETCRILGYDIPEGATVLVNVWAIGRDAKYWEDPEEFKPERFIDKNVDFKGTDFEFLPFGAGRRMCAGLSFGLANVELPLASLLYHFDWKLPDDKEIDMSESFGVGAKKRLPLKLLALPYN